MASLERALEELAVASRLLQSEGETARAARLLNEQAAVLMRMGDALRAKELLRESRKVFQSLDQDDPVTLRELAETDHLTAWLPLYAAMVPGREQDGYRMALERAAAAERVYRRLDDVRELARVWETMGRLERLQRRHDEALRHLEAAAAAQTRLGDLTGLGRTTEAMSDVLNQCGREAEAIALLRESIRFNQEKGSLIGLFFNRRAFTDMAGAWLALAVVAMFVRSPPTLAWGPVWSALAIGAGLWLLCCVVLAAALRGGADSMRWLLIGGGFFLLVAPFAGMRLALLANTALDEAPATPQLHDVRALEVHGPTIKLEIADSNGESLALAIPRDRGDPDLTADATRVTLHTRPGALGWRWVERIGP
jgi:tetratricopeptide (TPR) repeat protein